MGLAEPKKRTKISHDPNNTTWFRSTAGYGHRILSAQGWTPGSFLGAQNAVHSTSYTAASASHIRVVLKDDTLGLGARPRNALTDDEPTGLDAFQDLLGRLNGKSETELAQEQRRREDVKLLSYVEKRWKSMTFVPGGYLVKDDPTKIVVLSEKESHVSSDRETCTTTSRKWRKKDKRKREVEPAEDAAKSTSLSPKPDSTTHNFAGRPFIDETVESRTQRKEKKKRKKGTTIGQTAEESESGSRNTVKFSIPGIGSTHGDMAEASFNPERVVKVKEHRPLGRQVIRSRYIKQKKMALMDAKSLNEV
ncbi:telomerase inhibitor [Emydomyces testavorans]|uniref:Protein PXR1 n=1 Tax=Emydomyces testavorans TaxID=2070801 RepID=A0AAF0IJN8_9EURO|nr:telomerase inhibitor [Emydomyces testavorans]